MLHAVKLQKCSCSNVHSAKIQPILVHALCNQIKNCENHAIMLA